MAARMRERNANQCALELGQGGLKQCRCIRAQGLGLSPAGKHGRPSFTARLREDERQELRWLRANLRELLVVGVRDGTLGVEDAASAAFVLAAAVRGALEQWQASPTDVETHCDEAQLAAQLVARFATGADRVRADGGVGDFDFRGGAG